MTRWCADVRPTRSGAEIGANDATAAVYEPAFVTVFTIKTPASRWRCAVQQLAAAGSCERREQAQDGAVRAGRRARPASGADSPDPPCGCLWWLLVY